ncbi:4881_t:CDS:2 [Paraglomus brasilianum]|uniref:4881_t:CDS:1 n=1 Tax=Paraglomus brasilianum TaxID=144538 RepID=A0A9N8VWJ4_9GLOM|nr:4881_t:CDS:2 [Paraglomus brasilianum]
MEPISNVLTDKIPPRRSELFLIKKMRTLFLLIAYVCVAAFFAWKLYKLCQHETKLIYQMDYGDISAPSFNAFDLSFVNPFNDEAALIAIVLEITIVDAKYSGSDAYLAAWFGDKETISDLQNAASQTPIGLDYYYYLATAVVDNNYYLAKNQSYLFLFERKISKPLTQNALNVLSGKSDHNTIATISSLFVSYPYYLNDAGYASVTMKPKSYMVETETETPNLSIIDLFSAVGGIYAATIATYRCLYGADKIDPWGWVQNFPCIRYRVRSALRDSLSPNIPFTNTVLTKDCSIDEKVIAIEQRQLALELFLREYVVNVDNGVYGKIAAMSVVDTSAEKDDIEIT